MNTETSGTESPASLESFAGKVVAQITDAERRIAAFEVYAKEKRLQTELKVIEHLKASTVTLDQKLDTLKKRQVANIGRAKTEIDTIAAALKRSLDDLATKLETPAAK
jgi:hypothetical protein